MDSKTIGKVTLKRDEFKGYTHYYVIYRVSQDTRLILVERYQKDRFKSYTLYFNSGSKSLGLLESDLRAFKDSYNNIITISFERLVFKHILGSNKINLPLETFMKAIKEIIKYDRDTIDMYLDLDDQTISSFGDFIQEL